MKDFREIIMYSKEKLEQIFGHYILQCRPGDWEHAKRVVSWIEELGSAREDLYLIMIAGYIHDIGWYGLIKNGEKLTKEELIKLQPQADKQTDSLIKKSLENFNLTTKERAQILRLVRASETYITTSVDEEIIVDADNLSKTDPDHVREKYKKEDWLKICSLFEEKFPDRIKTTTGKNIYKEKLAKLRSSLERELNSRSML